MHSRYVKDTMCLEADLTSFISRFLAASFNSSSLALTAAVLSIVCSRVTYFTVELVSGVFSWCLTVSLCLNNFFAPALKSIVVLQYLHLTTPENKMC